MCLIGVTPLYDSQYQNIWMLPEYLDAVREAGGTPIILTHTTNQEELAQIVNMCDGFVFTGGHDLDPAIYREEKLPCCGEVSPERDGMETLLMDLVLKKDKPVLCICRGLQLLNACMGGTLYQDLPSQFVPAPGAANICHKQEKPYAIPSHAVQILPGSLLSECLKGITELSINTLHHQAIKYLAPDLRASAIAPDGIVEAAELPDKRFFLGVQFHPEYMPKDHVVRLLFTRLVSEAK